MNNSKKKMPDRFALASEAKQELMALVKKAANKRAVKAILALRPAIDACIHAETQCDVFNCAAGSAMEIARIEMLAHIKDARENPKLTRKHLKKPL